MLITPAAFPDLRLRRMRQAPWLRALVRENRLCAADLILPVFVYLCFTESLLEVSIAVAQPTTLTVIAATMISYLPVRLTLAFQPPFSYYDLASGLICFGIYLYSVV